MNKKQILFIKICFYIGFIADLLASIPLIFPDVAKIMFGLNNFNAGDNYLYVSRIGASLMLGWTSLLLWGSFKPVERKGILLLTIFPVLFGLVISSIIAVFTGFIEIKYMIPLWIFYTLVIPLYIIAYILANKIKLEK